MVTHPELLNDMLMWLFWMVFFCAFTQNVYLTTLIIGRKLYGTEPNPNGVQDAITPAWQIRNSFISIGLLVAFFISSIYVFKWYVAVAISAAAFFIVIPLVSKSLMYQPCSIFIVKKIRNDLVKRQQGYIQNGDHVRLEAITDVIQRLDQITNLN